MAKEELAERLQLLATETNEDRDELLTDLLCIVYPSKTVQNS